MSSVSKGRPGLSLCPGTKSPPKNLEKDVLKQEKEILKQKEYVPKQDDEEKSEKNPIFLTLFLSFLSRGTSRDGTGQAVKILSRPVARFSACPVVPLSRDKEGISVPLSRQVALSRPVGNTSFVQSSQYYRYPKFYVLSQLCVKYFIGTNLCKKTRFM